MGNTNAGTLSDLQRGVDLFREDWEDFSYRGRINRKESSKYLHEGFWSWREAYPGQLFRAHFQTTDTHGDFPAPPPFAGLFDTPAESGSWRESNQRLGEFEFGGRGPILPPGILRGSAGRHFSLWGRACTTKRWPTTIIGSGSSSTG